MLLACYGLTLAPGVTFWDAGEFISAAWGWGIPHPPGTPLYVALGHVWAHLLAPVLGAARAMNLLSAVATATAGAATAWLFVADAFGAHGSADVTSYSSWRGVTAALCAGLMASAWANATETEVYAIALLHVMLMLACAMRAADSPGARGERWTYAMAYAMLIAPAVHLSVLVAGPAAIALAARDRNGRWYAARAVALTGALIIAAAVGRMSVVLSLAGLALVVAAAFAPQLASRIGRSSPSSRPPEEERGSRPAPGGVVMLLGLTVVASSALLIMLLRARHDPLLNQGNPSTLGGLADVIARRQYDVAGVWPRRAPVWLQLANVAQYLDWQAALGWGRGVFTTPARVAATAVFVMLGAVGARALRRESRRLGDAMLVLLVSGTLGVAVYLNMRAGASLGWGLLPDSVPHEARERDYFFVYGFWAWGCLVACGAAEVVRMRRWRAPVMLLIVLLPLAGNWRVSDRGRQPEADAAATVAHMLLASAPRGAVLFLAGDNDSYPLWYAQQVEGVRRDVTPVTLPLLSARWYTDEIARRSGLRWRAEEHVPGTEWRHEQQAVLIARAARAAGRTVVASPRLTVAERALLGSGWRLAGVGYRASAASHTASDSAGIDVPASIPFLRPEPAVLPPADAVDDASRTMLTLLRCPALARPRLLSEATRDSLEVSCNFR